MYNEFKEKNVNAIFNILQKVFIFEKEPQKIGLSQFKDPEHKEKKEEPSLNKKDVKLSDLMRRN